MLDADARVAALVLELLRDRDKGWKDAYPLPEHLAACPSTRVVEVETRTEMWFDTGVEATRLTARLACPHEAAEWEWADLGELPRLLEDLTT